MTICPKCHISMSAYYGVSIASNFHNEPTNVDILNGYDCWNCGKWIEANEVPEFIPLVRKVNTEQSKRTQVINDSVDKHWLEIRELRSRRVAVSTICDSLGFIGAHSTYQKRILERERSEGVVRTRKRSPGIVYAKRKPRFIQEHLRGKYVEASV